MDSMIAHVELLSYCSYADFVEDIIGIINHHFRVQLGYSYLYKYGQ